MKHVYQIKVKDKWYANFNLEAVAARYARIHKINGRLVHGYDRDDFCRGQYTVAWEERSALCILNRRLPDVVKVISPTREERWVRPDHPLYEKLRNHPAVSILLTYNEMKSL